MKKMRVQMTVRRRILRISSLAILVFLLFAACAYAAPGISVTKDGINIGTVENTKDTAATIQVLLLLTILSLAPSILIMMTSFTRIIIVLSFLRNALGTQQMPPNQILIGLALFLTFFVMSPVVKDLNDNAYQPFSKGQISQQTALDNSSGIIKKFMLKYARDKDLALFASFSGLKPNVKKQDLSLTIVIPAFIISELKTAFEMGFIIYIPFLIIDMVVASTLMAMGMMMLPPIMISLPFKILLFVLVDGWNLLVQSIFKTFTG
jgi:flagellar biosynthesis protein FliP